MIFSPPSRLTFALLLLGAPLSGQQASALSALMHGRVDEVPRLAEQALAATPGNGRPHEWICRADYAQGLTDAAVKECETAVAALPDDSEAQMWLGRALGQKAEHANPFAAFGIAKRVHNAFETAWRLDPANVEAASDLGEFYIAAPGMVGGGRDKVPALAQAIRAHSVSRSRRLLAELAEKNNDPAKAESEYKAALAAGKASESYVDLANFYQNHKRSSDAVAVLKQELAADTRHGPATLDMASILMDANAEPGLAEQTLRAYIASPNQTDAAPVFRAHFLLGRLLARRGDRTAARVEYTAALALASHYQPARKALEAE